MNNKKNKKGVSTIISVLVILMFVLVATAIVWKVVLPMIKNTTNRINACGPDILGKIEIDKVHTCYQEGGASSPNTLKVSIKVKDIETDKLIIFVSMDGKTKKFEETQQANSGEVYTLDNNGEIISKPELIEVAPVIDGEQCDVVDSISNIPDCE